MREMEVLPEGKMMTLHCKMGNHSFQIPSRRGRPPHSCSDCKAQAALNALNNKPAPDGPEAQARMAHAREKKAERAQERARNESAQQQQHRERVRNTLPAMHEMWNRSFTIAMRENTKAAWDKCDSLMQSYLNAKRMV